MHAARNYGAVLQTFALQEYCNKQGLSVEIVNYKRYNQTNIGYLFSINKKFQDSNLKKILFFIKTIIPKIKTTKLFSSFLKRRLNITKHEILVNSKLNLIPQAEVYCVGSDQVWNPCANNGLDKMYFFDGVKGKKISYASSIGVQEVNDDTKNLYKKYLSSFDSVSVREQTSIAILNDCGIKANCVLDPTLLLDIDEWKSFCKNEQIKSEPYLLLYYFGNATNIMDTASEIAKDKKLKIKRISVGFERYMNDEDVERFISPERFVALFLYSSYVITNSFHGTVFSINFRKEFLTWPVTENNARFTNVLALFNLENRNLRTVKNYDNEIDYDSVFKILEQERHYSKNYLNNAIGI